MGFNVMFDYFFLQLSRCMGGTAVPQLDPPITTAQTLAPNDIPGSGWQHPYLDYFGFTFI